MFCNDLGRATISVPRCRLPDCGSRTWYRLPHDCAESRPAILTINGGFSNNRVALFGTGEPTACLASGKMSPSSWSKRTKRSRVHASRGRSLSRRLNEVSARNVDGRVAKQWSERGGSHVINAGILSAQGTVQRRTSRHTR